MGKPHPILDGIQALDRKRDVLREIIVPKAEPAPRAPDRLTASPFEIDHRAELLKEMRADADVLDKQAALLTHKALSLRISADHLEAHPPE